MCDCINCVTSSYSEGMTMWQWVSLYLMCQKFLMKCSREIIKTSTLLSHTIEIVPMHNAFIKPFYFTSAIKYSLPVCMSWNVPYVHSLSHIGYWKSCTFLYINFIFFFFYKKKKQAQMWTRDLDVMYDCDIFICVVRPMRCGRRKNILLELLSKRGCHLSNPEDWHLGKVFCSDTKIHHHICLWSFRNDFFSFSKKEFIGQDDYDIMVIIYLNCRVISC